MSSRKHIVVFAEDPAVLRTKQLVLQEIGYSVLGVRTVRELDFALSRGVFDLAILGRTVAPEHKLAGAKCIKSKVPNLPILEICDHSPCVDKPDYVLHTSDPNELTEAVKSILGAGTKSAHS